MRNLIFLVLIVTAGYKAYDHLSSSGPSSFDSAGNPSTLVFTINNCKACEQTIDFLEDRNIPYVEHNTEKDESASKLHNEYDGGNRYPYIVSGNLTATGLGHINFVSMLGQVYGMDALTTAEKLAFNTHFDENDSPQLVMYATPTCGYCKKARNYFNENNVPYIERDITNSATAGRDYKTLKIGGTPMFYYGYKSTGGWASSDAVMDLIKGFN